MGLLLVLYGTLNLWLSKTPVPIATRQSICGLMICQASDSDSPTAINPAADKPLRLAQQALRLDPASAYRWADLAEAEINARNLDAGKYCIRQALADAPGNPAILFHAAHIFLRLEDYPEAIRRLIAVLRNPDLSAYYNRVFNLYSEMDLPLSDLLNQGLPHSPNAANAFLRFWVEQGRLDEAQETWSWINKNSLTSLQSAGSYATLLLKSDRSDDAMRSWMQDTAQVDPEYGKTNWIYNGSFEAAPVDCPFDWHLVSNASVTSERDGEVSYKGGSSLRLKFETTPDDSAPFAYQTVLLKPGKWQVRAMMRTLILTGDQGVVVHVIDAQDTVRLDVATDSFTHTQEWTAISKTFEVGPATHLARVEIMRPPAGETGIRLTGTVWLDSVSLTPVP